MRDTIRKSANRYSRVPRAVRNSTAAADRMAASRAVASRALAENKCPACGRPVRENLALAGWVQCSQFGAPSFRSDPKRAACDWQGFTV